MNKGLRTTDVLGQHLLAEFHDCSAELLNDCKFVENTMRDSADIAGATIVTSSFHPFSPHGISGIVVVKESHFAIHTWPEYNYAAVDIFSCNDKMKYTKAYEFLISRFQSKKHTFTVVPRGMLTEMQVNKWVTN